MSDKTYTVGKRPWCYADSAEDAFCTRAADGKTHLGVYEWTTTPLDDGTVRISNPRRLDRHPATKLPTEDAP